MTIICEKLSEFDLFLLSGLVWSCLVWSSREGHVISGTSLSGIIHREHFSHHGELRVWVQAENQNGPAKSQAVVFNTADISKSVLHILLHKYRHRQQQQ